MGNHSTATLEPAAPPAAGRQGPLASISAKAVMAVTGIGLTIFVIGHMVGNLQLFLGPEALNGYAAKLKGMSEVLWAVRLGLLAFFLAHIYLGVRLSLDNARARPVPYAFKDYRKATLASRTMLYSGLVLLAFVIFHLAHYTFGWLYPEYLTFHDPKDPTRHDVYRMTVEGFRVWWVSLAYIVSMLLLGLHLSHGVSGMFQSLGWTSPRYLPWINRAASVVAIALMAGNIAMPLAVLLRIVNLPGEK
jgi:succinate dehydrogenase / fumarate reductase cytochrome b subunit